MTVQGGVEGALFLLALPHWAPGPHQMDVA